MGICEKFDYTNWPYDVHECEFTFGSWMKVGEELNYDSKKCTIETKKSARSNAWKLKNATIRYDKGSYASYNETFPTLEINFELERHSDFYIDGISVPSFILMIANLVIFYFEPKSTTRLILILLVIISHEIYMEFLYWM